MRAHPCTHTNTARHWQDPHLHGAFFQLRVWRRRPSGWNSAPFLQICGFCGILSWKVCKRWGPSSAAIHLLHQGASRLSVLGAASIVTISTKTTVWKWLVCGGFCSAALKGDKDDGHYLFILQEVSLSLLALLFPFCRLPAWHNWAICSGSS